MFYKHGQADLEEHIRQEEAAMSVRTKARQQGISGWMGLVRTVRDCKTQVRVVCALCEGMHGMCPSRNAGAWREVWLLEYCVGMEGSVPPRILCGHGGKCVSLDNAWAGREVCLLALDPTTAQSRIPRPQF